MAGARRRLALGLAAFFLALALPGAMLVHTAYDQLKWESFRRQQLAAEELAQRIDGGLAELVRREDARPVDDYRFAGLAPGAPRSPLADLPAADEVPGLIGWFEVDAEGAFATPLVPDPGVSPAAYGLGPEDIALRQARAEAIRAVLAVSRLAEREAAEPASAGGTAAPSPRAAPRQREASPSGSLADIAESADVPVEIEDRDAMEETPAPRLQRAPGSGRAAAPPPAPPPAAAPRETTPTLPPTAPWAGAPDFADTADEHPARSPAERRKTLAASKDERGTRLSQAAFDRLAEADIASAPEPERRAQRDALAFRGKPDRQEARLAAPRPPPQAAGAPLPAAPAATASIPALGPGPEPDHIPTPEPGRDPLRLFGGEREPLRLGRLERGHFVLFRNALRGGERVVQGLLVADGPFLDGFLGRPYAASLLAGAADLTAAYRGTPLAVFRGGPGDGGRYRDLASGRSLSGDLSHTLTGELLHRARLGEPFGGLTLTFGVRRLPAPPGAASLAALAAALGLILGVGTWLLGRLGARQIQLAEQQQAFVSAVSHELKTPLTSIRMYAEMLDGGLAAESRRPAYYRYIREESERLSRLIANVLTLSRIGRGALSLDPQPLPVDALMTQVRERIAGPAAQAGFRVDLKCPGDCPEDCPDTGPSPGPVLADADAFLQVLINLADNAFKFAAESDTKVLEIACTHLPAPRGRGPGTWRFTVRDYGPGIPRRQRRAVFRLFYRGEDATRRAVAGTGIGLALVERLVRAMDGRVEVTARQPGAELAVELPAGGASSARSTPVSANGRK